MKTYHLLILAIVLLVQACATSPNSNSWRLVWQDDFNGSQLDTTVWTRIPRGAPDWMNTQNDTADNLVSINAGKLSLFGRVNDYCPNDTAHFVTGGVWTKGKKALAPGRIEVCARLSNARGAWPAIWSMGFDDIKEPWPYGGEIDIMERLNGDPYAYQTVHSPYTLSHEQFAHGATGRIDNGEYNVYGVDIEKDSIIFHINGVKTLTYPRNTELPEEEQYPYYKEQFLLIDAQLGGRWVGSVSPEDLPAVMEIDWVRSYVRDDNYSRQSLFFEGTKPIANKEYEVFINGMSIPVYPAHGKYDGGVYYYASFDICGESEVCIRTAGNFDNLSILPENQGIKPKHRGHDEISFKLDSPAKLSIERDGNRYPLMLFANTPAAVPSISDKVIVLEPGEYEAVYHLTSGQSLYLKEGAILHGAILAEGDDITIAGRGIVTGERYEKFNGPAKYIFQARNCHNLNLEGLVFTSPWDWTMELTNCDGVDIDNVKLLCSNIANDGAFNICDSKNVTVRNSFARVQSEIFANESEDISCQNCQFRAGRTEF